MSFSGNPLNADQDKQTGVDDGLADSGVSDQSEPNTSSSSFINTRLGSNTPTSRQASPGVSPRLGPTRFSSSDRFSDSQYDSSSFSGLGSLWRRKQPLKSQQRAKRKVGRAWYGKKRVKGLVAVIGLLGFFLLFNWMMLLRLQDHGVDQRERSSGNSSSASVSVSIRVRTYQSQFSI